MIKLFLQAKFLDRLSLWTPNLGMETLRAEIRFNIYSSMIAPHCAICNLLSPFKIFENQLTDEQMEIFRPPKESQILIPSSAFTSKVKNEDTKLESKDSSPLLVCIDCRVCVHSGKNSLFHHFNNCNYKHFLIVDSLLWCQRCIV